MRKSPVWIIEIFWVGKISSGYVGRLTSTLDACSPSVYRLRFHSRALRAAAVSNVDFFRSASATVPPAW